MNLITHLATHLVRASSLAVCLAASIACTSAHAQWMWKDEAGRLVVSDQPPPPNVPLSRIVKAPKQRTSEVTAAPPKEGDAQSAAPKADASKPDAAKTLADKDLDYKQRQKEQAEAAKKAADEASKAKAMQENCSAVRGNLAALQAGGRSARVNEKGERTYLDDSQRAAEIARAQSQVSQYCK